MFDNASPRPWTYHAAPSVNNPGHNRDWIEDATGAVVVQNVGHVDGPLICRAVNLLASDLPCEVVVPGTVIRHGAKMETLIEAIALRS